MVMLILIIVSVIGVGGMQIAMMGERGARNDRDMQVALQAAEAALIDAEDDIFTPGGSTRRSIFSPTVNVTAFADDCGGGGNNVGLCNPTTSGKPVWLTVDFTDTTKTTGLGQFTGRSLTNANPSNPSSSSLPSGVQPFQAPRYIIEWIPDPLNASVTTPTPSYVYRVTAMGFGPRRDIQAVVQMIYRP